MGPRLEVGAQLGRTFPPVPVQPIDGAPQAREEAVSRLHVLRRSLFQALAQNAPLPLYGVQVRRALWEIRNDGAASSTQRLHVAIEPQASLVVLDEIIINRNITDIMLNKNLVIYLIVIALLMLQKLSIVLCNNTTRNSSLSFLSIKSRSTEAKNNFRNVSDIVLAHWAYTRRPCATQF